MTSRRRCVSVLLWWGVGGGGLQSLAFAWVGVFSGRPASSPITEDVPYDPINPYGESKVMVEKMLRWFDSIHGLRSICLRYFNASGAEPRGGFGEEHEPETHLIPLLLRAVKSGKPVTIFGVD